MTDDGVRVRDEAHMDRALALALEGWGRVAPNPLVGAVVVAGDQVVGEGFHAQYGAEHAERTALAEGGERAAGATLYVTLEPCRHQGKTPPCTEAILRAGIDRVVYGCRDPDKVAGGGARVLLGAGVDVQGGVRGVAAARLNGPFLWDRLGRGPWLSLKLGLSLDGRIAARPGQRTAITGAAAAEYVHRLRAGHDAIMVGGRTAVIDDPLLTVRHGPAPRVPPTRIVLDPRLELSANSRLAGSLDEAPLLVLCGEGAASERRRKLERVGAEVATVRLSGAGLCLEEVLRELEARNLRSVLVEGGGRLAGALLAGGFIRRQYLIYAPVLLGADGVPAMGAGITTEDNEWSVVRREVLGSDSLLELEDRRAIEAFMEAA
jgi:diaminohydroxyphosphoribosylaminopyrimidine deaminase/5-amino-6-(5-phosphoribosylamino)uracil reductase